VIVFVPVVPSVFVRHLALVTDHMLMTSLGGILGENLVHPAGAIRFLLVPENVNLSFEAISRRESGIAGFVLLRHLVGCSADPFFHRAIAVRTPLAPMPVFIVADSEKRRCHLESIRELRNGGEYIPAASAVADNVPSLRVHPGRQLPAHRRQAVDNVMYLHRSRIRRSRGSAPSSHIDPYRAELLLCQSPHRARHILPRPVIPAHHRHDGQILQGVIPYSLGIQRTRPVNRGTEFNHSPFDHVHVSPNQD